MPWLSATFVVDSNAAELLSDALLGVGALSVDLGDADAGTAFERPIFDEPDGAPAGQWLHARMSALFDVDADVPALMARAFEEAQVPATTAYEVARVEDEDWVRKTQSQFTPQHVTDRLWIVPTWHEPPDPAAINIVLDPGLAFGTGTHPTTRLCLRWLDAKIAGGESVVDFGCGSGILAIAALKLGAGSASGVDIDPQAVTAADRNARQNQVGATFVTAAGQLQAGRIVVANILAKPLIVLAPLIADLTLPGGALALSGILAEQADEVREAYRAWYDFEPAQEEAGWVLLTATRR
ncbi:MAG TPA: 50S ribosomal protein L11 methyltransferase [Burkholderiales bacterium]|nr:50S ribosomal protein L11 methyltransferase [Burkholderiales bacterium]